jgi:hypothetical protein
LAAVLAARYGHVSLTLHITATHAIDVNGCCRIPICLACAPPSVQFVAFETYDFDENSVTIGACPNVASVLYGALMGGSVELLSKLASGADFTTKARVADFFLWGDPGLGPPSFTL